ncbi:MAG: hypothetical protein K6V97_04115 [Actinomycetia bacterium]|nr:hypothetical protein [Actinomycetes bacterium]
MPRNKGWFRVYDRMIDSPEILELSDTEFRLLVSLWALASAAGDHGRLAGYRHTTLQRRLLPTQSVEAVAAMMAHLVDLGLVEGEEGAYRIARWDEHQYGYPSRIPEDRADRSGKDKVSESERKAMGQSSDRDGAAIAQRTDSERKDNGKLDPDPDPDQETQKDFPARAHEGTPEQLDEFLAWFPPLAPLRPQLAGFADRDLRRSTGDHLTRFVAQGMALDLIALGLQEALDRGKGMAYALTILRGYYAEGYRTLADYDRAHQGPRSLSPGRPLATGPPARAAPAEADWEAEARALAAQGRRYQDLPIVAR